MHRAFSIFALGRLLGLAVVRLGGLGFGAHRVWSDARKLRLLLLVISLEAVLVRIVERASESASTATGRAQMTVAARLLFFGCEGRGCVGTEGAKSDDGKAEGQNRKLHL